jgi:hypothetical protein
MLAGGRQRREDLVRRLSSRIAFCPARMAVSTASIAAVSLLLKWQRCLLSCCLVGLTSEFSISRKRQSAVTPMDTKWSETDIRACHERWRTLAFTFCDCFLGDKERATTAAQDAFAAFLLDSHEADHNRVPLKLLQYAMGVALDQGPREKTLSPADELENTIPELPPAERAVFILRGILDLSPFEVAVIGRTTSDEVHRLWTDSLLHLHDLWV